MQFWISQIAKHQGGELLLERSHFVDFLCKHCIQDKACLQWLKLLRTFPKLSLLSETRNLAATGWDESFSMGRAGDTELTKRHRSDFRAAPAAPSKLAEAAAKKCREQHVTLRHADRHAQASISSIKGGVFFLWTSKRPLPKKDTGTLAEKTHHPPPPFPRAPDTPKLIL